MLATVWVEVEDSGDGKRVQVEVKREGYVFDEDALAQLAADAVAQVAAAAFMEGP